MAGRGRAYREKRRKDVTAPSGDIYTIRKPGARALTKLFKGSSEKVVLPEDIDEMLSDESMKEMAEEIIDKQSAEEIIASTDELIIACVINPKIVADETDDDDELWIGDVDIADYFFLSKEIAEFAGVTTEKLRELFRSLGGASGALGGPDSSVDPPTA